MSSYLGVDVSKEQLDVVLLREGQASARGTFRNERRGFNSLRHWLQKRHAQVAHVCLEATGTYGDALAYFLHEAGYKVSVVNPARIKAYGDSRLSRNKTDALDAALIADFCRTQQPDAWSPPPPEQRELQALVRHWQNLSQMRQQEVNRRAAGIASATVLQTLNEHIAFLDQQLQQLQQQIHDHIDRHPHLRQQRV